MDDATNKNQTSVEKKYTPKIQVKWNKKFFVSFHLYFSILYKMVIKLKKRLICVCPLRPFYTNTPKNTGEKPLVGTGLSWQQLFYLTVMNKINRYFIQFKYLSHILMPVESIDAILVVTKEPEQRQNCHFCIEKQNERLMKHIIYTFHSHAIKSLQ